MWQLGLAEKGACGKTTTLCKQTTSLNHSFLSITVYNRTAYLGICIAETAWMKEL